jgi:hypothetical protein
VWTLAQREPPLWHGGRLETPSMFSGLALAIAGKTLAVSFEFGGVWMTRDGMEHPFAEIEELRGRLDANARVDAAALAFEGSADNAALFATVQDTKRTQQIVRVDAQGRTRRLAEVELDGADEERRLVAPVRALAWDATRRTLWSAAGGAGIMRSTAPGAPSWRAAQAAS